jgi:tetratricopeptide (TPR) repeat protein
VSGLGSHTGPRLPFAFHAAGTTGALTLADHDLLGWLRIERLELEIPELALDLREAPDGGEPVAPERFQRRRARLRAAAFHIDPRAVERRLAEVAPALTRQGVSQAAVRCQSGHLAITARVADGLAAADVSLRIYLTGAGQTLRAVAGAVRVYGHLPTPGPVLAHRIMAAIVGAPDDGTTTGGGPRLGGLCDVEIDALPAVLWRVLPPSGWRLPATSAVDLVRASIGRGGIHVAYAATDGEPDLGGPAVALLAAHDAMLPADELLRRGQLDEAMRGYRALLAAGGPDQPILIDRMLSIAAARPSWFLDGEELARQSLGRWPDYAPAHAALASISLAKGDPREAAGHLAALADLGAQDGDDDAAVLASLAAARLLRVLEPRAATGLYERVLDHQPGNPEASEALAERLADEGRWTELVRLLRARSGASAPARPRDQVARDHLRTAEVLALRLGDHAGARAELERALALEPGDPAVHEGAATIASAAGDADAARAAWGEVARLCTERRDRRGEVRAWTRRAALAEAAGDLDGADQDWGRALAAEPTSAEALRGAAGAAARRGDHRGAAALYEQLIASGLPASDAARAELERARALVALGDDDDARDALGRAASSKHEIAADAHALLATVRQRGEGPGGAAASLDDAIGALVAAADDAFADPGHGGDGDHMLTRAALLSIERARLLDQAGDDRAAGSWRRAHELARPRAPEVARDAARALLERDAGDATSQRQWIDAILATRPPVGERANLLVRRAQLRIAEIPPDAVAALLDLGEALTIGDDEVLRREALDLQAEILASTGDIRGRAQALAARARLSRSSADRAHAETAAAAAWLAADEPAAALPHGSRAAHEIDEGPTVDVDLRRRVLETLGEAAWRQRAWGDVIRAYRTLLVGDGAPASHGEVAATHAYRLAIACDKLGDTDEAIGALVRLVGNPDASGDLRGHARRLLADLHDRTGEPVKAAAALEAFADDPASGAGDPARADALYRAGELHRRAGAAEDAVRCLEGALRLVDDHLPALDALELVQRDVGDLERVATILGRKVAASARHPGRQKALLGRLAQLQVQLGRPEVALATFRRALELDPDFRPALRFIADEARRRGDIDEAAQAQLRLAGELPGDREPSGGADDEDDVPSRERAEAVLALAELALAAPDAPWLERARQVAARLAPSAALAPELREAIAQLRGDEAQAVDAGAIAEDASRQMRQGALRNLADVARAGGRFEEARGHLAAARELMGGADASLLRDLADVSAELGDWPACADQLTELAAVLGGDVAIRGRAPSPTPSHLGEPALRRGPRQADILTELADVCYDRLGDIPRARAAMRAAADAHGHGARRDATLRLLAAEAVSRHDHADAVDAYLAIADDRRTAADVVALATAWQRLGRDHRAVGILEDARAGGRLSDEGAMLLFALLQERRRKSDLATALERRAASVPPAEARQRLGEALVLHRDSLGDEAAAARVEAALAALAPADGGAPDVSEERTAAVEPVAGADETARRPTTRPAEIERMAAAAADAGDLRGATELHADALQARLRAGAPSDEVMGAVAALRTMARRGGHADLLVRALFDAAGRAHAPLAAELYAEAAAVASGDLGDDQVAVDALVHSHRAAPDDERILGDLAAALRRAGDTGRLAEAYERAARAASGAARARALLELGLIHRDAWNDALRSAAHLAEAHRADPDLAEVWLPLADALVAGDDIEGARGLYERALARTDLDDRTRAFLQDRLEVLGRDPGVIAGEIRPPSPRRRARDTVVTPLLAIADHDTEVVEVADAPGGAGEARPPTYEDFTITGASPHADHTATLRGVFGAWKPPAPADSPAPVPDTATATAAAPVAVAVADPVSAAVPDTAEVPDTAQVPDTHDAAAEVPDTAQVPDTHAAAADVPDTAGVPDTHDAAAEVPDTAGVPDTAEVPDTHAAAAAEVPDTANTAQVPDTAASGEDDYEAVTVTTEADGDAGDIEPSAPALRAESPSLVPPPPPMIPGSAYDRELTHAATLAATGEVTAAIARYEHAATLAPELADGGTDTRALVALEDLYGQLGDSDAMTEVLGRQIVATADAHQRAILWQRRAILYRDLLHREAETYRCLKEAHACSPDDADIAYELRAVAMARGEWALAAALLYREIAAATTARDRGALHLELALVYDEKLLEPDQARVNYEQALTLDPDIPAARRPLAEIYDRASRATDAAHMFERAAAVARPGDRGRLLRRAGAAQVRAGHIGDARRLYELALRSARDAGDDDTAQSTQGDLARLVAAPGRAALLEQRLAASEAHDERVAALDQLLADAEARGDSDDAARHATALLTVEPTHGAAYRVLAARAESHGDWSLLATLLEARASHSDDPAEQASLLYQLGRVHEAERGDPGAAARAYDSALDAAPDHAAALDARADLALRDGDLALADLLYARLGAAHSTLPADALWMRRADIAESLGDDGRALGYAREAARAQPPRHAALAQLARLAAKTGALDEALAAARAAFELLPADDVAAIVAARLELADLSRRADDAPTAIYHLEQVITEDPRNQRALDGLAALYEARHAWTASVRVLRALAGLADNPARRADVLYRLGELLLTRLHDPLDADDAFLRASDLDPGHLPTLRRLLDVYWRADDPTALVEVATELVAKNALLDPATDRATLARAAVAAAASAAMNLAGAIIHHLGDDAAPRLATALVELADRSGELTLEDAARALGDLHARGQGPSLAHVSAAATTLPGGAPVTSALAR